MTVSSPGVWILVLVAAVVSLAAIYWLLRANRNDDFNLALSKFRNLKTVLGSANNAPSTCINAAIDTIQTCQEAIAHAPNNGDAYLLLANAYLGVAYRFNENGIYSLAIPYFAAVMKFWSDNRQMYTANKSEAWELLAMLAGAGARLPDHSLKDKNLNALARVLHGDYQAVFEDAINPNHLTNIRREMLSWIELDNALEYMEAGHYDLALGNCDSALKLCPKLAAVYFMRAQVKVAQGDLHGALENINTFEDMNGPNPTSEMTRIMIQDRLDPVF